MPWPVLKVLLCFIIYYLLYYIILLLYYYLLYILSAVSRAIDFAMQSAAFCVITDQSLMVRGGSKTH